MALETRKQSMEFERSICMPSAQVNLQAEAMLSGAGRDSVDIILEDASVLINAVSAQPGRLTVEGMVVCQAAYRQGGAAIIRAAEARTPLQYVFEDERIGSGMNGTADAAVTHVESGFLNGRIHFRVTVELRCAVSKMESAELITALDGVPGAECCMAEIASVRCGAEATAQVNVTETLALPHELDAQATLMDFAAVTIEKAERDLGGIMVTGRVNAEVLLAGGMPGRPAAMVKYPMAFRQLVEMPEWLTENVHAAAAVEGIRSELTETGAPGEMGLRLDANIVLQVRALQTQRVDCVENAYAVGETDFAVEQRAMELLSDIRSETWDDMFRGTLLLPEHMPSVSSILAAHARPAVTGCDGKDAEGVIEISVVYMPSDGDMPLTVREELPFQLHCAHPTEMPDWVLAESVSCEASALMADRLEIRCGMRFRSAVRTTACHRIAAQVTTCEAEKRRPGIVMYWPDKQDTAWQIGRRYHVPVQRVRDAAGGGEIRPGSALILRI